MFCEMCFVQYSRDFWLLENARNTQYTTSVLCIVSFFVVSSVFLCVSCVLWKYRNTLAKHSQNAKNTRKTPQNTRKTKHHKTPQNTF